MKKSFVKLGKMLEDNISLVISCLIIGSLAIVISVGIYNGYPKQGEVIKKRYEPAYTSTSYKTVRRGEKQERVPVQEYHDEHFVITIRGYNKREKLVDYSFYVPESEYQKIELGQWYVIEK